MLAGSVAPMAHRMLCYKMEQSIGVPKTRPISLTVSVTQRCNSRCRTCNIWKHRAAGQELSVGEYETIFRTLGSKVLWYTLSGGEPFLRDDLVDIVKVVKRYTEPAVINIPTNGLLPQKTLNSVRDILRITAPDTTLIVNVSLDGIGKDHDDIRGVPGNFNKFEETYSGLKELKQQYPASFEIGVHSVISKFNVANLLTLFNFVKDNLRPDSYISEIAENREELLNVDDDISPPVDSYKEIIRQLQQEIRGTLLHNKGLTGVIQAFRLSYYDYVIKELQEKRRIIPCYAGQVSAQISPWGDIWPCCILAYKADMGNVRDFGLDFSRLWYSDKAKQVRKQVAEGDCYCPMANVHYTNMALTPAAMVSVMKNYAGARIQRQR